MSSGILGFEATHTASRGGRWEKQIVKVSSSNNINLSNQEIPHSRVN